MSVFYWRGGAPAVAGVHTLEYGGTWAPGDQEKITIGGATLIITAGTAVATTDIAAAVAAAVNGDLETPGFIDDELRNSNGQDIQQFKPVTATVAGSVVTLTTDLGVKIAISEAKVSTSGTSTLTEVVVATGPYHVSNPENYLGGALPTNGNKLVFDAGNVPVWYDLDYFRANSIGLDVDFIGDFRGQVGLPAYNQTYGYKEYLPRALELFGTGKTLRFLKGSSGVTDHGDIHLDLQGMTASSFASSHARGAASRYGIPNVYVYGGGNGAGTAFGAITIERGQVSFDRGDIELDASDAMQPAGVKLGAAGLADKECTVFFGEDSQVSESTIWNQAGGDVYLRAPSKVGAQKVDLVCKSGNLYLASAGQYGDVYVYEGATLYVQNGSLFDNAISYGGVINCDQGTVSCAIGSIKLYKGSKLYDKNGLCVNNFDLVGCSLEDVTIVLPDNQHHAVIEATP